MATETWLYIYEGAPRGDEEERRPIYIGIGERMGRVFEQHNPDAERLRDAEGTLIRQTLEPFSSARTRSRPRLSRSTSPLSWGWIRSMTLRTRTSCSTRMTRWSRTLRGRRRASTWGRRFSRAMVRSLRMIWRGRSLCHHPEFSRGRASAFGGNPGEVFIERAAQAWNVAPDKRPKIRRLVAVLTGSRHVILGSWEVDPSREWELVCPEASSPYSSRVRIPVPHPEQDDVDEMKGKRYVGHLQVGVLYSPDIA